MMMHWCIRNKLFGCAQYHSFKYVILWPFQIANVVIDRKRRILELFVCIKTLYSHLCLYIFTNHVELCIFSCVMNIDIFIDYIPVLNSWDVVPKTCNLIIYRGCVMKMYGCVYARTSSTVFYQVGEEIAGFFTLLYCTLTVTLTHSNVDWWGYMSARPT